MTVAVDRPDPIHVGPQLGEDGLRLLESARRAEVGGVQHGFADRVVGDLQQRAHQVDDVGG